MYYFYFHVLFLHELFLVVHNIFKRIKNVLLRDIKNNISEFIQNEIKQK